MVPFPRLKLFDNGILPLRAKKTRAGFTGKKPGLIKSNPLIFIWIFVFPQLWITVLATLLPRNTLTV
jgi:hypothetical protein